MLCPKCGGTTRVRDTRYEGKENEVFRRHVCMDCDNELFTVEFEIENTAKFNDLWKHSVRGAGGGYEKA